MGTKESRGNYLHMAGPSKVVKALYAASAGEEGGDVAVFEGGVLVTNREGGGGGVHHAAADLPVPSSPAHPL